MIKKTPKDIGPVGQSRAREHRSAASSDQEMLTVPEVAERLRVARSWVYGHADVLGAYRLGKYVRFDWSRVLERLRSGEIARGDVGVAAQRPSSTTVDSTR